MEGGGPRGIHDFGPWPAAPVLLACSGGADSTFLAWSWRKAEAQAPLPPARVVVVDHGQRSGSGEEAAAAAALYRGMGLEVEIRRATVSPGADEGRLREARYRELRAAAEACGAARVLTAHHARDQAETLLLRILRGTGIAGLTGIPERRELAPGIELLRPLLDHDPEVMRASLREAGVAWIEDPSNQDPEVAGRNRLRRLWPELEALASARPEQALERLRREALAHEAMVDEVDAAGTSFETLPSHLRRQLLRRRLREAGATPSPARLADLEGALLRRGTAAVDADRRLLLRAGLLVLVGRRGDRPEGGAGPDGEVLEQDR